MMPIFMFVSLFLAVSLKLGVFAKIFQKWLNIFQNQYIQPNSLQISKIQPAYEFSLQDWLEYSFYQELYMQRQNLISPSHTDSN